MTLRTFVIMELGARASWRVARPIMRVSFELTRAAVLAPIRVADFGRRTWRSIQSIGELPLG